MARATDIRPIVRLKSTAGTGYTYVTRKNRRNDPDRWCCASTTRSRAGIPTSAKNAEQEREMKKGIHPEYQPVVFQDTAR